SPIGWFKGSFFASFILICLISQPSLAANTPATSVSKAIPHINIFQPRFFFIQSPRNTRTPPEIATMETKNSPTSQDNEDDEKTVEIIYIFWFTPSPTCRFWTIPPPP